MRAIPTPSANDEPGFHSDMPIIELTEHDTQAIEASVISSTPLVVKTADRVTHEIWPTPTEPNKAWGIKPLNPNSGIQLTGVQRPACEGFESTSRQTEPGEKNRDEPQRPCLTPLRSGQGHLKPFSFDSNLEPNPQNLHRGEANGPPEPIERLGHLSGGGLSSGMPHEGPADPVSG